MYTLDNLSTHEATLNNIRSKILFQEIFDQSTWRLYLSDDNPNIESLIKRFINAHAQIPGIFSDRMTAYMPVNIFRYNEQCKTIEGFFYINGAVVKIHDNSTTLLGLFVDEETASMWSYPDIFLSYSNRHQAEENEKI